MLLFIAAVLAAVFLPFLLPGFMMTGNNGLTGSFFKNVFFVNVTFLGDGTFAFAVACFLLFVLNRKDLSLRLLLTLVICIASTQLIKNIMSPLPAHIYFEEGTPAAGIYQNVISSHAAIAFTLAGFFSLFLQKSRGRIVLISVAALVAYSRMYLAGESVLAIAVGIFPALIACSFAYRISFYKKAGKGYYRRNAFRRNNHRELYPA